MFSSLARSVYTKALNTVNAANIDPPNSSSSIINNAYQSNRPTRELMMPHAVFDLSEGGQAELSPTESVKCGMDVWHIPHGSIGVSHKSRAIAIYNRYLIDVMDTSSNKRLQQCASVIPIKGEFALNIRYAVI